MKIAGSKNPGAWFRANKVLVSLTGLEQTALLDVLDVKCTYGDAAYNDLVAMAAETGVDLGADIPATKLNWLAKMINVGIPLQVWNGRWTFTTYTLTGSPMNRKATANYQDNIRKFARELRHEVRKFIFANRQIRDAFDIGDRTQQNPGGLPDADPAT